MSLIFFFGVFDKVPRLGMAAEYMEMHGVPGNLLPLVIITELGGGLMLLLGYRTRLAAFLLAGFSVMAAAIFHSDLGNIDQNIMLLKNLAISGGLVILFVHGAGRFSLDARAGR